MDQITSHTIDRLRDGLVTLNDVAAIVRGDLPYLTERDLAAILCNVMADGPHPVALVIEPIIRAEIARLRAARVTSPLLLRAA